MRRKIIRGNKQFHSKRTTKLTFENVCQIGSQEPAQQHARRNKKAKQKSQYKEPYFFNYHRTLTLEIFVSSVARIGVAAFLVHVFESTLHSDFCIVNVLGLTFEDLRQDSAFRK